MQIEIASSGARTPHNEDWAGHFSTSGQSDLVVIDGATSVADRDYIDAVEGDVRWFVKHFAAALGTAIDQGLTQAEAIHAAADAAYAQFRERSAGQEVPLYAWPIAALSWVRARATRNGHRLALYCLGDCKVLMRTPDGAIEDLDSFVNPQEAILRAEIARLPADVLGDPAARLERLMPMLRARRAYQNTATATNILRLRPAGGFGARTAAFDAPEGSAVLAMTDGFYRLVDTYGLHTPRSLFALCMEHGLQAAIEQLRGHEAAARSGPSTPLKDADDASAILWHPMASGRGSAMAG